MRNATTTSREAREYAEQYRTLFSIIWSCVSTIFLCIWVTMHPNIPQPLTTGRLKQRWAFLAYARRFIRSRLPTFLCALLAPEWVLSVSLLQLQSAYRLKCHLNISLKHAFFIIMGGYHLFQRGIPPLDGKHDDYDTPIHPLDPFDVKYLLDVGKLTLIRSNELDDKCKGDWVAKLLVLSQIIWFFVQCVGRVLQRLPLSELEIITFAYTLMNLIIYAVWWEKPYQVSEPVRVYEHLPARANLCQEEGSMIDLLHMLYAYITGDQDEWTNLRKRLSTPSFYTGRFRFSEKDGDSWTTLTLASTAIAFGLPHILGILSPFSSTMLQILWNMSTIFMCAAPLIILIPFLRSKGRRHKTVTAWMMVLSAIALPSIYVMCRLITLMIAALSLRNLPPKAFHNIEWSRFFPHI